jgi:hypothetical protein
MYLLVLAVFLSIAGCSKEKQEEDSPPKKVNNRMPPNTNPAK